MKKNKKSYLVPIVLIAIIVSIIFGLFYYTTYGIEIKDSAGCNIIPTQIYKSIDGDPFLEGYYTEEGTCAYTPFSAIDEAYYLYEIKNSKEVKIKAYPLKLPIIALNCDKEYVLKVYDGCDFSE